MFEKFSFYENLSKYRTKYPKIFNMAIKEITIIPK